MPDLFAPRSRRRLFLKPGREKTIRNRHPWVFDGSIKREDGEPQAAIADLVGPGNTLLASGFYSRRSQIRMRAITFGQELTPEWLRRRIAGAISQRATVLSEETTCARLIHSEGDGLSGLVVDRYDDVLVVEITSAGLDMIKDLVIEVLVEEASKSGPVRRVLLENDLPARKLEGLPRESEWIEISTGDSPHSSQVEVFENGLRFLVEPGLGQKTGFFIDQRENRALVRSISKGLRVLNVFSYTGSFGVYAAAGGATSVEEVDVSERAMALARKNHELNGTSCNLVMSVEDAFAHLRHLRSERQEFDLVIVDPPAFAKSRGQVDRAARGYKDINMQALHLVRDGGHLMTYSCSGHVSSDLFQKIIFGAVLDARREASIVQRLGAGPRSPGLALLPRGRLPERDAARGKGRRKDILGGLTNCQRFSNCESGRLPAF